jgi:hypothetical protein
VTIFSEGRDHRVGAGRQVIGSWIQRDRQGELERASSSVQLAVEAPFG